MYLIPIKDLSGIKALIKREQIKKIVKIFLKFPRTLQNRHAVTRPSFGIASSTGMRSEWITNHAKLVQYVEPQDDHIFQYFHKCSPSDIGMFGSICVI